MERRCSSLDPLRPDDEDRDRDVDLDRHALLLRDSLRLPPVRSALAVDTARPSGTENLPELETEFKFVFAGGDLI
jgi:hypothetical protein